MFKGLQGGGGGGGGGWVGGWVGGFLVTGLLGIYIPRSPEQI